MGIEELKKDIEKSAEKRFREIEADTALKIKEIKDELKSRIKEIKGSIELKTHGELQKIEQIVIAEAKSEETQNILEKKRAAIGLVIEEAKKAIKRHNKEYIRRLFAKAQTQFDLGEIYCSKEDADILGIKATTKDFGGGLIAENKDGTIGVDYSYNAILNQIRDRFIQDIAEVLFE